MSSHLLSELDSTTDSVASSPRSEHHAPQDALIRARLMCSFGGKILPRPQDNRLCYVGGDTRIVAVHRSTPFSAFITKLSKLSGKATKYIDNILSFKSFHFHVSYIQFHFDIFVYWLGISNLTVKYQLPNEDLDALISVTTDEDLENMMDEYDRLAQNHNPRLARLRVFLFSKDDDGSRPSSISSLMGGLANREHWFFDALNNGANSSGLERGRSEASSIFSEVPDYLLGPENSDEVQVRDPNLRTRQLQHEDVSVSDTGSPAPGVSSSFRSTSAAPTVLPSMPDLRPVKTKLDNTEEVLESKHSQTVSFVEQPVTQPIAYSGSPMLHYVPDSHYSAQPVQQIPIYYVPGNVQSGNPPFQPVQVQAQYVQQYPVPAGQIPIGYPYHQSAPGVGQAYREVTSVDPYDPALRVAPDGVNQPVYYDYGYRNSGPVPVHPGMVAQGGEELARSGSDMTPGRIS